MEKKNYVEETMRDSLITSINPSQSQFEMLNLEDIRLMIVAIVKLLLMMLLLLLLLMMMLLLLLLLLLLFFQDR